jgi:maleate isomerase
MEGKEYSYAFDPWPLGWRGRIGMIMPSVEDGPATYEYRRLCPQGVTLHQTRVMLHKLTEKDLVKMRDDSIYAAELLATAGVDVITYVCTAGGFIKGMEWDKSLIKDIEDKTGIKAITAISACVEALKFMKIKKLLLYAPYKEEITEKVIKYLHDAGFEVLGYESLGLDSVLDVCRLPPWETYRGLMKLHKKCPDADGIFVSGGAVRTLPIFEFVERDMGLPMITNPTAVMWKCLKLIGIKEKISGFGKLMESCGN